MKDLLTPTELLEALIRVRRIEEDMRRLGSLMGLTEEEIEARTQPMRKRKTKCRT